MARKGSRAGCSLGDLLFSSAFTLVLTSCRTILRKQELVTTVPLRNDTDHFNTGYNFDSHSWTFEDASWLDDVFFLVVAKAPELLSKSRATIRIVHSVLTSFGFLMNLKPGKSAAMFAWCGRGYELAQKSLARDHRNVIRFTGTDKQKPALFVVDRYKYLGSIIATRMQMLPELKHRERTCVSALRAIRKRVHKNIIIFAVRNLLEQYRV